jgi:formylglycine-generating enzyme required for sulfatase activity
MKHIFTLLLLITLTLSANTRGLKKIVSSNGEEITRYTNSYALLIGASQYTNGWPSLNTIPSELDTLQAVLQNKGFNVTRVNNPKGHQLSDAYRDFVNKHGYDKNNRLLFFYSGHGYSNTNGSKGYLVPVDAPNPNSDAKGFKRKSLNMTNLLALSRDMEANHALFLFDSCFSGTIFKTRALRKRGPTLARSMSIQVRQFITAGSANQEVPAKSVFLPLFIDGINGEADFTNDGYVTGSELGMFLSSNVPKYKNQNPEYGKIKDYELSQGDFIFMAPKKRQKNSSFTFNDNVPSTFSLTINPTPSDAVVKITNIKPRYYDGIQLEAKNYEIEVSRRGYFTKSGSVDLRSDLSVDVVLKKRQEKKSIVKPIHKSYEPEMVHISRGTFTMGSNDEQKDEKPLHQVSIGKDFLLGKYEVTVGQYRTFVDDSGHDTSGGCWYYDTEWKESASKNWSSPGFYQSDNSPVACVSYNDAKAYTQWISRKTGKRYRLPSESEWEYAARAGSSTKYHFSNSDANLAQYAWYSKNSGQRTHKVGQKKPNAFGLYDMHGNVWEWCEDWYADSYNNTPRNERANAKGAKTYKVLRGGSWINTSNFFRSAFRIRNNPINRNYNNGFRLAGTLP